MKLNYDVIVIGAGHAGAEAAAVAANLNCEVLLITMDLNKIASMSCNPAMGGIAKGQLIREIDALGGLSAYVTDETMIQFRMLNKSKGAAMWSPRAQSDRLKFSQTWRKYLEKIPNLYFWQDKVKSLIIENNFVTGVVTDWNVQFTSKTVILTAGTFLNGVMYVGDKTVEGGRVGDESVKGLSDQLKSFNIPTLKMKTGTPVRIDGRSVDFSKFEIQHGDIPPEKFSFDPLSKMRLPSIPCHIVYTNKNVHKELEKGFSFSPLFSGKIKGIGPRYCPSIEDKLITFSSKDQHLLFLEPEGVNSNEYYLNGFSSSLPLDVQYTALSKIDGFSNVKIFRPGYAIEYDYFDPMFLHHTLESKILNNLYFAGQVNGTTGYEEAAAQGMIAGINAAHKVKEKNNFVLGRDTSYIGVLIDDLVTKGVDEPYRMFTSRAEYRLQLRQDNADLRLSNLAIDIGLLTPHRNEVFENRIKQISKLTKLLSIISVTPKKINSYLNKINSSPLKQSVKADKLLLRPEINLTDLLPFLELDTQFKEDIIHTTQYNIKYHEYTQKEKICAKKPDDFDNKIIPDTIDFAKFKSISTEARQKLEKQKPKTIGEAKRIPGVSPSDINVLLVYMGR
ncbi:MAG: tRNA uridine-5-carboxymethylaminomethyl(34) synthesis enzyme MnmG [Bacteroidales bacterium]|nr:tRNA uridine-5-carboxymethylaminomethyl(34) synthesis enzyme MnmG [Bacteroidales bacterium]